MFINTFINYNIIFCEFISIDCATISMLKDLVVRNFVTEFNFDYAS